MFDKALVQILEEERQLRDEAEALARELVKVLEELAFSLAPEQVERLRKGTPGYFQGLGPAGWKDLLLEATRSLKVGGWPVERRSDIETLETLKREVTELKRENEQLLALRQPEEAPTPPASPVTSAALVLPIPDLANKPPVAYADLFQNWPREGYILAVVATTGWSMRLAVAEVAAKKFGVTAGSGSLRRIFARLALCGLLDSVVEVIARGLKAAYVSLTPSGKNVVRACGLQPVPSEWERLALFHQGALQPKHAALVCSYTYHARQHGFHAEVCPERKGTFRPDVLVCRNGRSVLVEVEGGTSQREGRMRKWQLQAKAQGIAALCAPTPEVRAWLVDEAKAAGAKHGLATDIKSLIIGSEGLWVEEW